jgi:hypothetical protein
LFKKIFGFFCYFFFLSSRSSSERRGSSLLDLSLLSLLLSKTLGKELGVLSSSILLGLGVAELEGLEVSLALESLGSNKTLDLGSLGVGLITLDNLTADNKLANIILLGEVEEFSNVVGTLGAESLGNRGVGQTSNVGLTLLNNNKGDDSKIVTNNATTDRLSLSLTSATGTVARVTLGKKELDTGGVENTLLHGETLLVVTTSDLKDVALELVTKGITLDLLAHSLLVENTDLVFIIDLDELLRAVGRVGNVEL